MNWNNRNRSLLSMPFFKAVGAIIFILFAMGVVGYMDAEDAEVEEQRYCEMVDLWKADKKAGIPANERRGWPPFKQNEVICK